MTGNFKHDLDSTDFYNDWVMLTTLNNSVYVRKQDNRLLPKGEFILPSPYELLEYLKVLFECQYLVQSVNLFENNNQLSMQVPMKHIYYTECKDLLEWDKHLGYIEVRYFEHTYELERLQKLILNK